MRNTTSRLLSFTVFRFLRQSTSRLFRHLSLRPYPSPLQGGRLSGHHSNRNEVGRIQHELLYRGRIRPAPSVPQSAFQIAGIELRREEGAIIDEVLSRTKTGDVFDGQDLAEDFSRAGSVRIDMNIRVRGVFTDHDKVGNRIGEGIITT